MLLDVKLVKNMSVRAGCFTYSVNNSFTMTTKVIKFPDYSQIFHILGDQEAVVYIEHFANSFWLCSAQQPFAMNIFTKSSEDRTDPTNSGYEMSLDKGLLTAHLCCLGDSQRGHCAPGSFLSAYNLPCTKLTLFLSEMSRFTDGCQICYAAAFQWK